jgi:hypothetical protein
MQWRYNQSKRGDFCDRMVEEIHRRGVLICRVHVSGDMATPKYTAKWVEIAARSSHVRFLCYSRSWRVEKIRPLLYAFGALPNVRLWLSADSETGYPPDVPEGIRVAWLQTTASEAVQGDLVFQVRKLRRLELPMAVQVCPQEKPEGRAKGANCSNCGICWRD